MTGLLHRRRDSPLALLTEDEARRIASNIAKLPSALSAIAFYSLPPGVMPWGGGSFIPQPVGRRYKLKGLMA